MIVRASAHFSKRLGDVAILASIDASTFAEFRDAVRGARFDAVLGRLYAPRAEWNEVRAALLAGGVEVEEDAAVTDWTRAEVLFQAELREAAHRRLDQFALKLAERGLYLRDYQREGVLWLSTRRCGLLTDEQGLGKTLQSLCAIPEGMGAIVVCPASLRGYWRDEVSRWRPDLHPIVYEGRGSYSAPVAGQCVVCSDSAFVGAKDLEKVFVPTFVAADEAHAYKEERSQRTVNMTTLCSAVRRNGGWTVGLTGTPLLNRPEELLCLATVFGCERLGWGSEPAFKRAFEVGPDFGYGPTFGTPKTAAREGLRRISLRRVRVDVLRELPPKSYRDIPVLLSRRARSTLDAAHERMADTLDALELNDAALSQWQWSDKMPGFEKYAEVRAEIAERKIPMTMEWADSCAAESLPAVVFSSHREPVDLLAQRDGWTSITGDTPIEERTRRVDGFQRGEYLGIAGTIGAMGTGFTLTHAADVLFVDKPFTPGLVDQAEDRVYRLGQDKPVLITSLVGDHPLERRLKKIHERKRAMVAASL